MHLFHEYEPIFQQCKARTLKQFTSSFISGVGGIRRPALGQTGVGLDLQGGQLRPLPPRGEPRPRAQIIRPLCTATLWHTAPCNGKELKTKDNAFIMCFYASTIICFPCGLHMYMHMCRLFLALKGHYHKLLSPFIDGTIQCA